MRTQVTLPPGHKGTKKLLAQSGEPPCVRYRYDATRQWRLNTVEWIVEKTPWHPARGVSNGAEVVKVYVDVQEVPLQRQVNQAGGR